MPATSSSVFAMRNVALVEHERMPVFAVITRLAHQYCCVILRFTTTVSTTLLARHGEVAETPLAARTALASVWLS